MAEINAHPILEVRDLTVEFRASRAWVRVVDGVSFSVCAGETLAVLGESGSGKTATGLALLGLLPRRSARVTGGEILFNGQNLAAQSAKGWQRVRGTGIGMVFQDPLSALNPLQSVGNQVSEGLRRRGLSRQAGRAAAAELLQKVGIPDATGRLDDYPHQFSGGMRQRVMIAIALALRPRVLVADEPTTALDVTVQAQIMRLLLDLQRETGMGLILISHDLGVVAETADKVAIMYAGRVVESGPLRDVYENPAHPYTRGLLAAIPRLETRPVRMATIPGAPPDFANLPAGCSYRPRCYQVAERCVQQPALIGIGSDTLAHRAACHFAGQSGE